MRAVLQRVSGASVSVDGAETARIGKGLVILFCAEDGDGEAEIDLFARKIAAMRIFEDEAGKMNRSVVDIGGAMLVVSQFTLAADWRRGNRPSFSRAARPEVAEPLYRAFCQRLRGIGIDVATGTFAATMAISLVNDGPVTIPMDSHGA